MLRAGRGPGVPAEGERRGHPLDGLECVERRTEVRVWPGGPRAGVLISLPMGRWRPLVEKGEAVVPRELLTDQHLLCISGMHCYATCHCRVTVVSRRSAVGSFEGKD